MGCNTLVVQTQGKNIKVGFLMLYPLPCLFNCNLKLKSFTAQPAGILISSISTFGELHWFDCYRKTSSIWPSNFQNFMMEEWICHIRDV